MNTYKQLAADFLRKYYRTKKISSGMRTMTEFKMSEIGMSLSDDRHLDVMFSSIASSSQLVFWIYSVKLGLVHLKVNPYVSFKKLILKNEDVQKRGFYPTHIVRILTFGDGNESVDIFEISEKEIKEGKNDLVAAKVI